jgi:hypothetical protein
MGKVNEGIKVCQTQTVYFIIPRTVDDKKLSLYQTKLTCKDI